MKRWCIVWESKVTTACGGRGKPVSLSRDTATLAVVDLNKKYSYLHHWVERWGLEETNIALPYKEEKEP